MGYFNRQSLDDCDMREFAPAKPTFHQEQCQADADRAARIIARAVALLSAGQARGWSHAISLAKKEVSQ